MAPCGYEGYKDGHTCLRIGPEGALEASPIFPPGSMQLFHTDLPTGMMSVHGTE